jgi:hypothetical protein
MVNKQQIVDFAGRKTLLGKYLLEIIFVEQFDWELLKQWEADRWYLKPPSSSITSLRITNTSLQETKSDIQMFGGHCLL